MSNEQKINKINITALNLTKKQHRENMEQREQIDELKILNFALQEDNKNLERELEELKAQLKELEELKAELRESEAVELFMLNTNDRDERLRAHYREGKVVDGKWVNNEEDEE